jgi:hypothetical protein
VKDRENFLCEKFNALIQERCRRQIISGETAKWSGMIRMTEDEIIETLEKGSQMVEMFYKNRIIPHSTFKSVDVLFSSHKLLENDWEGFTKILLGNLFGERILVPVKQELLKNSKLASDISLGVEEISMMVDDVTPRKYFQMLIDAQVSGFDTLQFRSKKPEFSYAKWRMMKAGWVATKASFIPDLQPDLIFTWGNSMQPIPSLVAPYLQKPTTESTFLDEMERAKKKYNNLFLASSLFLKTKFLPHGHGIKIIISGKSNPGFSFAQVRMSVEGEIFWNQLSSILSGPLTTLIRNSFHPLYLCPPFMSPFVATNKESADNEISLEISLGTGDGGSSVKFKDTTLITKIEQLLNLGDPEFFLLIEYSKNGDKDSFVPDGKLAEIWTKPSLILQAIKTGNSLL